MASVFVLNTGLYVMIMVIQGHKPFCFICCLIKALCAQCGGVIIHTTSECTSECGHSVAIVGCLSHLFPKCPYLS